MKAKTFRWLDDWRITTDLHRTGTRTARLGFYPALARLPVVPPECFFFLARVLPAVLPFLDRRAMAFVTLVVLPALSWAWIDDPFLDTRLGLGLRSFYSGATCFTGVSGCSRA